MDISRPDRVVGRNTVGAIQSGLVYGSIGLVEGLIARIRAEVGWPCRVIATGGDDALVLEGCGSSASATSTGRARALASSPRAGS